MYIKQTNLTNCGPTAIFNVFRHFSIKPPSLKSIARDTKWKKSVGITPRAIRTYLRDRGFLASYNTFKKTDLDSFLKKSKVVILFLRRPNNKDQHFMLIVAKHNRSYLTVNYSGFKDSVNVKYLSKDLIDYLVEQHLYSVVVGKA